MTDNVAQLIANLEAAAPQGPGRALSLVAVAEMAAKHKHTEEARRLTREALALGRADHRVLVRARKVLSTLIPGYHTPMMNDARRNAAWDKVLRRAIRPGMHVYEIGTGAGMLAMMAARAGAEHVTTCEFDPVVAELARELIAHNGYADRVTVLTKRSQNVDLERRADLLFCDIFGDGLFDFDPLYPVADAKARLLTPDAKIIPQQISMHVALAEWTDHDRCAALDAACGFDLTPMRDFVRTRHSMTISTPSLRLRSAPVELLRIDLRSPALPNERSAEAVCAVDEGGVVNGFARWIRLQLDEDTVLEPKPEPGGAFFSHFNFISAPRSQTLHAGERRRIKAYQQSRVLETWMEEV